MKMENEYREMVRKNGYALQYMPEALRTEPVSGGRYGKTARRLSMFPMNTGRWRCV
jgi:hypothetical protein